MNTEVEKKIQNMLYPFADEQYRQFNARTLATVPVENVIGVKTPWQRKIAKEIYNSQLKDAFLQSLPHATFEENQVHGFIIELEKDSNNVIELLNLFLPFVDNWATCDCVSPKVFKKNPPDLKTIKNWMKSEHVYICRFGIGMLMRYYLDIRFSPAYLDAVASIKRDEYYVNIMRAWFFATALTKQYNQTLPYIENCVLDKWTHNKAIQKAKESFRVPDEHKLYLNSLKVKL